MRNNLRTGWQITLGNMADGSSLRILDSLHSQQKAELLALGAEVTYAPDEVIFREEQPSRSVLVIKHGSVKVTRRAEDGANVVLAIRGENEIMGDEGALLSDARSATLVSITRVVGMDIRAEDFLEFVNDHELWPVMYRAAVRRRQEADQRTLLARLDVKKKLADILINLVRQLGRQVDGQWVIDSAFSQQELAGAIGASRDAVAIELRRLRDKGVVSTARRKIIVHDLDQLNNLATQ